MQTLLDDVRDRIESLEVFRYIDEDWGQLDEFALNPPVKWPVALVDLVSATPSNVGSGGQINNVVLRVRVADQRLGNSSQQAPADQRTAAGSALRAAQLVFGALHGWHKVDSAYSTLQRIRLQRMPRGDSMREYAVDFSCQVPQTDAAVVTTDLSSQVPAKYKPSVTVIR